MNEKETKNKEMNPHREGVLTSVDHRHWDVWMRKALEDYKAGIRNLEDLISENGQVIGALDRGNLAEVRAWIENRNAIVV